MEETLQDLQKCLGYNFKDADLLLRALTHPSYAAEQNPPVMDNQRLEFLGDAVLQLLTTDRIFHEHLDVQEGILTKMRSSLTHGGALVTYANSLELGRYLRLGKGEEKAGGRTRPSNLADAFEALLGALYLDGGLEAAKRFCVVIVEQLLDDIETLLACENPKGALQEYTQEHFQTTPTYEIMQISGPEHCPVFTVQLRIGDRELAIAKAGSRKNAEKRAAARGLEVLLKAKEDSLS